VHDLGNLRRSVTDRKIAGVAGGLGRHFDIDPTVVRVVLVVLALFGGAGLVLYGVAFLVVPEEGSDHALVGTSPSTRGAVLIGTAILAAALLLSNTFGGWWWHGGFPWPLALVVLVGALILMNRGKKMTSTPPPPAPPEPGYEVPPPPPYYGPASDYQPPRRTRRGPLLFAPTLALLAVALGALGLYDGLGGSVVAAAYPALALAVIGGMLVLGAWIGRAGGLIALGLATAIALAATSVADAVPFDSGRHIDATPTNAATVQDHYFLPAGQIRLDLTEVPPAALDGRTLSVRTRAGEIVVVLPRNLRAHVVADVSVGDVSIAGQHSNGGGIHEVRDLGTGPATVNLDLGTFVGQIEVRQVPATLPAPQGAGLTQGASQ
jgi:phage shock protein PspC (stress-responsive transcriptional regulator)